jgi:hypothetical protein
MASKKYQVFVSSTFLDLKDERQAVSKAILNLGHIPAGMELFPAADIDQLSFIKKVIDDCDYYILIIGGRYGSLSDSGLSFTELEYQYAVENKKPVLAFLHSDVSELKAGNVDTDRERIDKLKAFKDKVKSGRLVEFWSSIESLESKSLIALTNAFNEQPQVGWRRDTNELPQEAQIRLERLRETNERLRESVTFSRKKANELSEKLGNYESLEDAVVEVRYYSQEAGSRSAEISAEEVIREFASAMADGITSSEIEKGLFDHIAHKIDSRVETIATTSVSNVALFLEVYEICQRSNGLLTLIPEKKWLLKAAFKPLKKVIASKSLDDEIPF